MTSKQARRLIEARKPVEFLNEFYGDRFVATLIDMDRWNVYTADGGKYDRAELVVLNLNPVQE